MVRNGDEEEMGRNGDVYYFLYSFFSLIFNFIKYKLICHVVAWRDSFRTYDWAKALPVPDLTISQVGQLLAVV